MSDINPPNTAVPITLPTASQDDSQAAVHAYYAEVTKIFHDIVCDSAKKKILDPNSQPEFLFIACLLFVLEIMSEANQAGVGDEYSDTKRYSFDDILKVFSDKRYCMMLMVYCPDPEMWEWWFQYYRPSNADTRHAIFLQVQSYLDYLVEQHDSGQMTNELSTADGMLHL